MFLLPPEGFDADQIQIEPKLCKQLRVGLIGIMDPFCNFLHWEKSVKHLGMMIQTKQRCLERYYRRELFSWKWMKTLDSSQ